MLTKQDVWILVCGILALICGVVLHALAPLTEPPDTAALKDLSRLIVETEDQSIARCDSRQRDYDADDSQTYGAYEADRELEGRIVIQQGDRVYSPYDGQTFGSVEDTDIEHVVARSEAHHSGLCKASAATKRSFVLDPHNLTLAAPLVNRVEKGGKDFGEWQPTENRCWMAGTIVRVKRMYSLAVDPREYTALKNALALCQSTDMVYIEEAVKP